MDRKNDSVLTRVADTQRQLLDLKTEQLVGHSNTLIGILQSDLGFDMDFEMLNGERAYVTIFWEPYDFKEWQVSSYNDLRYGLFIGDIGAPSADRYDGRYVNVIPTGRVDNAGQILQFQIVNTSGVTKRILIKRYVLTTALAGDLYSGWSI